MSELNTTMSTAFRLAGFETPRQKLRQMMREAIEAHAIRVPSCAAFKAALSDAEEAPLLAALCADIIDDLVDDLYDGVLAEMRDRGIKPEVAILKQPQKFTETGYSRNGPRGCTERVARRPCQNCTSGRPPMPPCDAPPRRDRTCRGYRKHRALRSISTPQ